MTGGTIIRLIDVVLIILFGFLFITDYQAKSHVPVPRVEERSEPPEEESQVVRVIEIFARKDGEAPYYWFGNTGGVDPMLRRLPDSAALARMLAEQKAAYGDRLQVIIVPLRRARVRWVVDAFDLCREMGITRPILRIDPHYRHMTQRS